MDLSLPLSPEVARKYLPPRKPRAVSEGQLEHLAQARSERWEQHHKNNADRNAKIVASYKDGKGYRKVAEEFDLSYQTVINVIQRAAARGEVEIRPRGYNIRHQKEATS